jgi:hypothetical protein
MRKGALAFVAAAIAFAAFVQCTGDDPSLGPSGDAGPASGDATSTSDGPSSGDGGDPGATCDTSKIATDAKNCGRCGHDCLGAKCSEGRCEAADLAPTESQPTGIAVVDGMLFWASHDGTIRTCFAANCATTTKDFAVPAERVDGGYTGASTYTEQLLVDATHVYWPAFYTGYIHRCPRSGCAAGGPEKWVNIGPGAAQPANVAMDADHVYFTDEQANDVWRCAKSASPCVREHVAATGTILPRAIAVGGVNDGFLYWLSAGYKDEPPGTLAQVKKDLTDAEPFGMQFGITSPNALVVTASNVYYSSEDDADGGVNTGAIYKGLAANQAGAQPFATGLSRPGNLALDAQNVYWVEQGSGRIASCPRAGCGTGGPFVYAIGEDEPFGIAVDDQRIYWTTRSGGHVKSVPK